jgi:DNA-binding CsgD family transcriptional regulator
MMALTSQDETDLILPLFRGMEESPRFATFLARLRARTGAEYVGLVFRRPHASPEEESEFYAGLDINRAMRESGLGEIHAAARAHHDRLRPGRVYAADEFEDLDPIYRLQHERSLQALGIRDERVVRIAGEDGFNVLLILARSKACSAADSALLSNLAPYVAAASRNFVMLESQRIASAMAAEGLGRSGIGWILFDPSARVLAADAATRRSLRDTAGIGVRLGQRIAHAPPQAERAIAEAAAELAGNTGAAPRCVVLNDEPRIEAILSCANAVEVAGMVSPAMLALCRLPRPASGDRPARFARLFDLPPREAELAIALADGLSLAEAADTMGLTIETARNYSKRLYGKLGVRGQAELVRLVYESSAVLA